MSAKILLPTIEELKNTGAIFYDFDGVMTDNRVLVTNQGVEAVFCNRSDGLAIAHFKELGIHDAYSANAELKKLLLDGNPYAMVYGAVWLLHGEKPADSGINGTQEEKNGLHRMFFDYLTGEYAGNPDYPISLLENAR